MMAATCLQRKIMHYSACEIDKKAQSTLPRKTWVVMERQIARVV